MAGLKRGLCVVIAAAACLTAAAPAPADELDPVRTVPLPCEAVPAGNGAARTEHGGLKHLAGVCEFTGTDVEFQSRRDAQGRRRDYAFLGSYGSGLVIFDVTDPARPRYAGASRIGGYQSDVQVRGNTAITTLDGYRDTPLTDSSCIHTRYPTANGQGVDVWRLDYDRASANFAVRQDTCLANPPGGAHNSTLDPTGRWLAISNSSSDYAVDVVDLTKRIGPGRTPLHRYRLIDGGHRDQPGRCPPGAPFRCVVMRLPNGKSTKGACGGRACWRPHDVHFSSDGRTMYVAALNSTFIVDVSHVLDPGIESVPAIAMIKNQNAPGGLGTSENIELSHQADVTSDGRMLVISDERGGGTENVDCNLPGGRLIGALHFWALRELPGVPASRGATPSRPRKLGIYINPQPALIADAVVPPFRLERACTVHVFRLGGDGSSSPGPADGANDGVSSLDGRQLTTAWFGAGVWYVDFSGRPDAAPADDIREDERTTWGNTLAWNIQPGADTWSAKEYKGSIFAGDQLRGFDTFSFQKRPRLSGNDPASGRGPVSGECSSRPRSKRPRVVRRRRTVIRARVTRRGRPLRGVRVRVRGPGFKRRLRTDRRGRAVVRVRPSHGGRAKVSAAACGASLHVLARRVARRRATAPRFTG